MYTSTLRSTDYLYGSSIIIITIIIIIMDLGGAFGELTRDTFSNALCKKTLTLSMSIRT